MAMAVETNPVKNDVEVLLAEDAVLEEIDEDNSLTTLSFGKSLSLPALSEVAQQPEEKEKQSPEPESPVKTRREFGNISPISELLDDDDLEVVSPGKEEDDECQLAAEAEGKVTPEPGHPNRASFPRLSDGRSSPILAYSPSLIKSPSSNNSKSRSTITSPSSGGSGGVGKRPRNIARMLDNISDHSSGEEEVNSVGMMMAKFSV